MDDSESNLEKIPEFNEENTACAFQIQNIPLPDVNIFASGMNSALARKPHFDVREVPLTPVLSFRQGWSPRTQQVTTFGMTFPEGIQFFTPKKEAEEESTFDPTPTWTKQKEESQHREHSKRRKKTTRLQPPKDALSLEDRLFYLLQPPIETWLHGQELVLPFEPFEFQYEGISWLFSQKSALLADEMGLGKTMQAITAIRLLLRSGQIRRILLVCPKPVIPNWQRELELWAEEIPVVTIEGDAVRRKMLWTIENIPLRIANYELLARDFAEIEGELSKFDLVVLDEAQRIKNRDAITAKVAKELPRKRSWALTGTPIENRPEELVSLMEFLEVVPQRATPDLRQLSKLASEHVLRRTKDLVLKDLPPRLDRDEYLDLNPAQQVAYTAAEKDGVIHLNEMGESISISHVFELVLRLKQITNFDPLTGESAKLDRLTADMEEIASSGGKAILFSQWTRCLDWISEKLRQRLPQCGTLIYHGGVPSKKREPILKRFEEDPDSHLLLMSYGTGAVGLNLQFAGYVFLYDRWWNPAVEDQAINRAHRIGQKSKVIVTKFISRGTIEERIDLVLRQKRAMFEQILGDPSESNLSLSMNAEEIFGLFDLKTRTGNTTRSIAPPKAEDDQAPAAA